MNDQEPLDPAPSNGELAPSESPNGEAPPPPIAVESPSRAWGARWGAILDEAGPGAARRVQRGQALARRGAVEDLRIEEGAITANVVADRQPYEVRLAWPVPGEPAWARATTALGAELRFLAALLDGSLPGALVDELEQAGIRVLPELADLDLHCGCDDPNALCPHVVAVHTTAGARIERDPTVLLRLRGRDRDELLRELRGESGQEPFADPALDLTRGLDAAHGDLDAIELRPAPVDDPASLLYHLGPPPGVDDLDPLAAIVERAAAGAWRLAAGDGAEAADEELLLAELRGQRVASAASLAGALGRDLTGVRDQLDRLFAEGTVLRTGSGERARYRASS